MGFLNIFTMGELVAITMVLLQLLLVTVMLRDKRLWRIRQNSEHPSAARVRLEGQSNVGRARRSAGTELPHGSSPRSSMSSRRRFPRFIRSSQDAQALFEEHRKELEAQLTQWQWGRGSGRVVHTDVQVKPRLLGAREHPQCLGVELARPDMNKVTEKDKHKNIRRRSSNSSVMLQRRRSVAIARLLPRLVVTMNPTVLESSSSSVELEYSTSTAAGRFLGRLRARLQRSLEALQTRYAQRRQCVSIRLKSQWWWRCWTQKRRRM